MESDNNLALSEWKRCQPEGVLAGRSPALPGAIDPKRRVPMIGIFSLSHKKRSGQVRSGQVK